nr:GNAT family N-acetyltransferase [Gammaproteobacteria bacterium]
MTIEPTPLIRRAETRDASRLAQLGAATFAETFGHLYPPEDLQTYLSSKHSVETWSRVLADPSRAVWLAELEQTPIAYVSVGPCKLPVKDLEETAGEVKQLYVLAPYQNLKLGSRLFETAVQWLEEQGRHPIYLGVWSQNFGAQRFYARYGFTKVGDYGFPVGKTVDHEFILKRA